MSPKRRYQSSSFDLGLGSPPPPPPPSSSPTGEHLNFALNGSSSNSPYSQSPFNRPITPAEIAVNPCLSSKKIHPRAVTAKEESLSSQIRSQTQRPTTTRGDRTYRVRHHHQNHYELPEKKSPTSLSQGIFGLPVIQDYLRNCHEHGDEFEELGGTVVEESQSQHNSFHQPPEPKPRMRSTLPSFRQGGACVSPTRAEAMDGILQVRPASRSRTRPEQSHHSASAGGALGRGSRRRVQSTAPNRPSTARQPPIAAPMDSNSAHGHDLENADANLQECVNRLKMSDWEEICEGFRKIQHMTVECPTKVKGVLKKIIWNGLPHLASSRTKVSRSACQCFKRLYETQKRSMEGEGDKVFQRLLDLCGGPCNKFIQDECKDALVSAVAHTDPFKSLSLIEMHASKHRNKNVREFGSFLLVNVLHNLSRDKIMNKEYAPKVIPLVVHFLREGQLNTRLNAKDCLEKIYDHPEFDMKLRQSVPPEKIRNVNDTLKKFRAALSRRS